MKEITREYLENLYYNNTNDHCCKVLNVSKVTLIKMINDCNIEKKGKGYNKKYNIAVGE